MKLGWYIICILAGAIVCFFLIRGCKTNPNLDILQQKKYVDSIVGINRDSLQKVFNDSLTYVKDSAKKITDSLVTIVKSDRYNDKVKAQQIAGLTATIANAQIKKDTTAELTACDSLKNAANQGLALVKKTMKDRDNLDSSYKAQISIRDQASARLNSLYAASNQQLFQIGLRYDSLYTDFKKLDTRPKRWSIGPGIGASWIGGKVVPVVEVGIHYNLFSF